MSLRCAARGPGKVAASALKPCELKFVDSISNLVCLRCRWGRRVGAGRWGRGEGGGGRDRGGGRDGGRGRGSPYGVRVE